MYTTLNIWFYDTLRSYDLFCINPDKYNFEPYFVRNGNVANPLFRVHNGMFVFNISPLEKELLNNIGFNLTFLNGDNEVESCISDPKMNLKVINEFYTKRAK